MKQWIPDEYDNCRERAQIDQLAANEDFKYFH